MKKSLLVLILGLCVFAVSCASFGDVMTGINQGLEATSENLKSQGY